MSRRDPRHTPAPARPASSPRPDPLGTSAIVCLLVALAGAPVAILARADDVPSVATYYVDNTNPTSTDTGPGTVSQPYRTISAAVKQRGGPGVTIAVLPGRYPEEVVIDSSGTSGTPFVIRALGGPVVVDGADDFGSPSRWQHHADGVYVAPSVTWAPRQVFVDGARLTPSSAAPESLPLNAFRHVTQAGLYVNLGGDDPGTRQTLVGRRAHGFRAYNKHWVILDGFTVVRTENRAIDISGGSADGILRNNVIRHAYRYGIALANVQRMRVEWNIVTDNQDHGISLSQNATGCTIQDNESARNAHPVLRQAAGIRLNASSYNLLQRNRLHHNQDTGEHLALGSDYNTSLQNLSWSNGDHGYDRLGARYTLSIGNVAWGNHKDGFSNEGFAPGGQMYNCIAVDNGLTTGRFNLWVDAESSVGFVSNHNILWNSNGQAPVKFGAVVHATLATYQTASGQDAQSLQADPRFADPAGGDFHLLAGSPAIDAAITSVPGWPATDAEGRARVDDPDVANTGVGPVRHADRGALEFITDQSPVVTAPDSVTVLAGAPLAVAVTAEDPDGDAIVSLVADMASLPVADDAVRTDLPGAPGGTLSTPPAGDAVFLVSPDRTAGTLSWTPGPLVAGSFLVRFTAANARSGSAMTMVTVLSRDRAPVVTAPESVTVEPGTPVVVTVTVSDPDGDSIATLEADLAALPVGEDAVRTDVPGDPNGTLSEPPAGGAVFLVGAGRTAGTLEWTPDPGVAGSFVVTFTAANALHGVASTRIQVLPRESRPPAVADSGRTTAAAAHGPPGRRVPPGESDPVVPLRPHLSPNPARPEATLRFLTSRDGPLLVDLYDVRGRRVRRLLGASLAPSGLQHIAIDGRDEGGTPLAPGLYLYRIQAREGVTAGRLLIVP